MRTKRPVVSVGVPVYNGGRFLRDCLECVQSQTFSDIEVLVFDNASTDRTEAIARDFVARDSRFSYFRQPANKGPLQNFADVLRAAKCPYFLWRAADDLSDLNYVEVLHGLLAQRPDKDLAVSRVLTRAYDGSFEVEHRYPGDSNLPGVFGCASRSLRGYGASWFYGLFRREAIAPIWLDVVARYHAANASDHLTLFPLLLDNRIIGSNATTFVQGVPAVADRKPRQRGADRHDEKIAQRRVFLEIAREQVASRFANPVSRGGYDLVAWLYADAKICSWRKVVRRGALRRLSGQTELDQFAQREMAPRDPLNGSAADGAEQTNRASSPCGNDHDRRA